MGIVEDLVPLIKDKRELRGISDDFVRKRVEEFLEEYPGIIDKYEESNSLKQFTRSIDYKIILKDVRALLREVYGVFILEKYKKMKEALDELEKDQSIANHMKILSMHRSSKERLPYYEQVYEKIFKITGTPNRILDLACGMNPLSYPFLGCEPEYLASDISPTLCNFINRYFKMRGVEGEAFVFDLLDFDKTKFADYAHSDVCFLFKALDPIESLKRDFSKELIEGLPADYIVASFAKQSIGGGKSIEGQKPWFENMLEELGLEFEFFEIENESFYVVKK